MVSRAAGPYRGCPSPPLHDVFVATADVLSSTGPCNLDTVDEIAIYSDDPSKRAVLIAAALALVTDVVVTAQVHPALLRRAVRLAIPVVLTRPVAGILTRLGV
jgi:hypothetical protein